MATNSPKLTIMTIYGMCVLVQKYLYNIPQPYICSILKKTFFSNVHLTIINIITHKTTMKWKIQYIYSVQLTGILSG